MGTTTQQNPAGISRTVVKRSTSEPVVELKLSPIYPWLLIVFGGIFFLLGLMIASPFGRDQNVALGILICVASAAAVVGGNYWRHHLPVMVRMTPRQLVLSRNWPRHVAVDWDEIVEIEKKTITLARHGVRHTSELVCIKLKKPLPVNDALNQSFPAYKRFNEVLMKGIKDNLLGGYDLSINPQDEFLRSADWFIAECKKRMTAAG
jgi:hypothetical protein